MWFAELSCLKGVLTLLTLLNSIKFAGRSGFNYFCYIILIAKNNLKINLTI